jgi:hypothetical protein
VSDSLLILAPLLVLAVVLLLGFAGCTFASGTPEPPPPPTLIFRARVPTNLTAELGVSFRWIRPTGTMEEATVTSFETDGADNVYERHISSPGNGIWHVSCEMVAQNGGGQESKSSPVCEFILQATSGTWVYSFQAAGIPLESFQIVCKGLKEK